MGKTQDQLIEKLKSGDTSTGEYVYKMYAPELLGVCMRYIRNKSDAEDVIQESFIDIFQKINQLKSNKAFKSWMVRIVVNNALGFLKKQQPDYDFDDLNESISEDDEADAPKDVKERILDCDISQGDMLEVISSLPSGFRTVFNLYVFEKMKHNEIAKELNISVSTSKSQLLRARKLIQKRLYEQMSDREQEDKKERAIFALFPIFMTEDLNYIDKLAFDKLNGMSIAPEQGVPDMSSSGNAASSSASIAKSKLASFIGSKVTWVASVVVGSAIVGTIMVTNNNEANDLPVVVSDSVDIEEEEHLNITTATTDTVKYEEALHEGAISSEKADVKVERPKAAPVKKVFVKKVIKVKQQKVITDTVFKTDTLHLY